jgi:multiple sugar transport system ATP-binding protein
VSALRVRGIVVRFGAVAALDGVDFEVGARERVVVLGPTGAGKTTLLRTIAGLETPQAGALELGGADATSLAPSARDVALVFQNFSLYPHWSVRGNLEFPLRAPGRALAPAEIRERVQWAAALLRIEKLLDRPARHLSGGEMQRVALGRALVRRPKLFLMDEPLTNLDAKLREELRIELRELARSLSTPVLWVTHDQAEALSMADRIVVLFEGRVLQDASPEEVYFRPASPVVSRLLGTPPMNVVDARAEGGWWRAPDGTPIVEASAGARDRATIGFRPEHVAVEGGSVEGTIEVVEDLGPARVLVVAWAGLRLHLLAPRSLAARPGDRIRPRVEPERIVVWDGT